MGKKLTKVKLVKKFYLKPRWAIGGTFKVTKGILNLGKRLGVFEQIKDEDEPDASDKKVIDTANKIVDTAEKITESVIIDKAVESVGELLKGDEKEKKPIKRRKRRTKKEIEEEKLKDKENDN